MDGRTDRQTDRPPDDIAEWPAESLLASSKARLKKTSFLCSNLCPPTFLPSPHNTGLSPPHWNSPTPVTKTKTKTKLPCPNPPVNHGTTVRSSGLPSMVCGLGMFFTLHCGDYQFPQGWQGEGNWSSMKIDLQGFVWEKILFQLTRESFVAETSGVCCLTSTGMPETPMQKSGTGWCFYATSRPITR